MNTTHKCWSLISLFSLTLCAGFIIHNLKLSWGRSKVFSIESITDLDTIGSGVAIAWAPDGSELAAASNYGSDLTVWDRSGRVIKRIHREGGGPALGGSLAFINGSSQLAFLPEQGADDGTALDIWDVTTGKVVSHVVGPEPGADYHRNRAQWFRASPDQATLVSGTRGQGQNVAFYRTSDWKTTHTSHIDDGVFSIDLFSHGQFAVVGSANGRFTIIDAATGLNMKTIQAYKPSPVGDELISSVAGSPDGKLIVVGVGITSTKGSFKGGTDEILMWDKSINRVILFRVDTGEQIAYLSEPAAPIQAVAWDPMGRFVAIADDKNGLFVWPMSPAPSDPQKIELRSQPFALEVSPNGDRIAVTTSSGVRIFSIKTP